MSEVRIGQVWADNDKRGYGRQVRIVDIIHVHVPFRGTRQGAEGTPFAIVEQVSARDVGFSVLNPAKPGRRTRIRLDRFKPTATGYRLVSEPTAGATDAE